jgi:hypothetical protein
MSADLDVFAVRAERRSPPPAPPNPDRRANAHRRIDGVASALTEAELELVADFAERIVGARP